MHSAKRRAEEYRAEARACFNVAERMSAREDRERMMAMAEHWLKLATIADAKAEQGKDEY